MYFSTKRFLLVVVASLSCIAVGLCVSFGTSDFPLEVGTQWTYAVTDTLMNGLRYDTVTVSVTGMTMLSGLRSAKIWVERSKDDTVTNYVVCDGNTIKFYAPSSESIPLQVLPSFFNITQIPLDNGGRSDTSWIVGSDEKVEVTAGTFKGTLHIHTTLKGIVCAWGITDTWLVPKIGIVKSLNRSGSKGFGHSELRELIAFHSPK